MGTIRTGPAGFDYEEWARIVYPNSKPPRGFDPLAHLARYFDTIEINSTFYRRHGRRRRKRWAERVD